MIKPQYLVIAALIVTYLVFSKAEAFEMRSWIDATGVTRHTNLPSRYVKDDGTLTALFVSDYRGKKGDYQPGTKPVQRTILTHAGKFAWSDTKELLSLYELQNALNQMPKRTQHAMLKRINYLKQEKAIKASWLVEAKLAQTRCTLWNPDIAIDACVELERRAFDRLSQTNTMPPEYYQRAVNFCNQLHPMYQQRIVCMEQSYTDYMLLVRH